MNFDEPDRFKLVSRVWPKINAPSGTAITIRIGQSSQVDNAETFTAPVVFTVGIDHYFDLFAQGRYLSFEFSSNSVQPWRLSGFDVEYRMGGYF